MIAALDFQYAGKSSASFNLQIASFGRNSEVSQTIGPNYNIIEEQVRNRDKPFFLGVEVGSKLTFPITLVYVNDVTQGPIHKQEISRISRWLFKREYHELKIIDEEYGEAVFNCILTNSKRVDISGYSYAIEVEAVCDRPWGYVTKTKVIQGQPYVDGVIPNSHKMSNFSSIEADIYPEVKIESTSGGVFGVGLLKDGEKGNFFYNLQPGEIVTVNNELNIITSSIGINRYDGYEFFWPKLSNERVDNFFVVGSAKATIKIKYPFIA